jgi:hypothetical protein
MPDTHLGASSEPLTARLGEQLDHPLAKLRAQGAASRDPQRWGFVEALARRAQGHDGKVRALLDLRLARALADLQAACEAGGGSGPCASSPAQRDHPARPGLADLLQALRQTSVDEPPAGEAHGAQALHAGPDSETPGATPSETTELKALRYFRSSWTQLSVTQRLQQSQARLPAHAGPLNSQALALRALTLMQQVSPSYLAHFMGHVESLLWLDQAQLRTTPAAPSGRSLRTKGRA